jgi:hypothetical protein
MPNHINGTSVDGTKWYEGQAARFGNFQNGAGFQALCDQNNDVVSGGVLNLNATYAVEAGIRTYRFGCIVSKLLVPAPPYYLEARIQTASGISANSTYWMYQANPKSQTGTEIDNIEAISNICTHTIYWQNGVYQSTQGNCGYPPDPSQAFHIYGLWVPAGGPYQFYIDGSPYETLGNGGDSNAFNEPNNIIAHIEDNYGEPGAGASGVEKIDYIRVYCPGCN